MNKYVTPMCMRLSDNITDTECEPLKKILDKMHYDPVEGINKIRIGKKYVPAVLFGNNLGTETLTKIKFEDTDQDPYNINAAAFVTRTSTKLEAEATDDDPTCLMGFGTQTITRAKGENTDQDFSQ
jgi:hypothetical protein